MDGWLGFNGILSTQVVVLGLISKRPLNLKFAAPPAIIGFMIFSYCLNHKMIISKHYPFQKVSDQCFFLNFKKSVCENHAKITVSGNLCTALKDYIRRCTEL